MSVTRAEPTAKKWNQRICLIVLPAIATVSMLSEDAKAAYFKKYPLGLVDEVEPKFL